ncbi:hypothetical protein LBMAG42_04420 [Deltaproteobacteria bacterium]|nr:hypothetical protein LBMAG42_04420 [Deltaproteobacteria bacterium]
MASRLLLLALLFVPGLSYAADKATGERLRELEDELGKVSSEVDDTRLNFSERSGLIGVSEARRRYEDAVYSYLVGDYESAATSFYILVQSRALGNADLARDSEWYLAECLVELGNLRTAEEVYRSIVDKGQTHPYFADAVRRNLEVYALLGDDAGFTGYYNTWIVSGKVPATDIVNYTLAKSFVHRKEFARAKSMFDAIAPTSPWYTRARYQLGVLMIQEGNLKQATTEFQKIETAAVSDDDQKRVQDLAILALGRLSYEVGDFAEASKYYGRIDRNSPEFADKLYESVWSYVKQGSAAEAREGAAERGSREAELAAADASDRWRDALGQVDNFLLAYPEHQYTAQMRVLQGHLHMKLKEYDAARTSYEDVVASYTPVAARLEELSQGTAEARHFIERIGDTGGTSGLPAYAIEMLLGREDVSRAIAAYLETGRQRQELDRAERDVADLQTALSSEKDTLGMFVAARNQLTTMRGAALAMRARLLEAELQYLRAKTSGPVKAEVTALGKELAGIEEGATAADSSVGSTTDRLQLYEAQVREVQQRAFRIQQVADEAAASGRSLAEVLSNGSSKLSPAETEKVRSELETARADLAKASSDLEAAQSEVVRKKVLRAVESGSIREDDVGRASAITKYASLRSRVASLRRNAQDTDSAALYAQIDRLWATLEKLETSSSDAARAVAAGEARETAAVRQRLASTAQKVTELRRDLDASAAATESVATRAVLIGLRGLQAEFEADVVDADKGIVDVYWLRRMENNDEQDTLVDERASMLHELDERFRVIRENLER